MRDIAGQRFSQVAGGPDPMGLCLLLSNISSVVCLCVLQCSLPPLPKGSSVLQWLSAWWVPHYGGLAMVNTASGDGFPPDSFLQHPPPLSLAMHLNLFVWSNANERHLILHDVLMGRFSYFTFNGSDQLDVCFLPVCSPCQKTMAWF